MADISDLPFRYRVMLRTYPWRRIEPVPVAHLGKPLDESRVALVTTAGLVPPPELPFDPEVKGGDFSFRVIRADANVRRLEEHHRMYVWRLTDALREDYPKLAALLGDERFLALAEAYAREHPSDRPDLGQFGRHLPSFLRRFPAPERSR